MIRCQLFLFRIFGQEGSSHTAIDSLMCECENGEIDR